MNSKQIAIKFLAPKIEDPKMIFMDKNIFKSILDWARDSAREFFTTQPTKFFLVHYIDDIAPIVDKYLINRVNKMYKDAFKKRNKLFMNLNSSEKTIEWIINRYINVFISLSTNNCYKEYIDITKIKIDLDKNEAYYISDIEEIIDFENLKKLPKKQIKKALQNVWEDSKYDFEFDIEEFDELCQIFNLCSRNVLEIGSLSELELIKEPIRSEYYQVIINFN